MVKKPKIGDLLDFDISRLASLRLDIAKLPAHCLMKAFGVSYICYLHLDNVKI